MNLMYKALFSSFCLLFIVSCVSDTSTNAKNPDESGINQNEVVLADGSNVQGIYAGELLPLNFNLHFKTVGLAGVQRDGDMFSAFVKINNGPKSIKHRQAIYTGRRCPNLNDDVNKDAYIDMKEAMVAIGKISIPLDADLDSQYGGMGEFPFGGETGKYFYQKSASFDRLFSDLKSEDTNPQDNIIKIPEEDGLTLPGRVLIIQGISENVLLPETIAVEEGESPHESLPLACVVLWKVAEMPEGLKPESN